MCLVSVLRKGTPKNTDEVYKFIRNGASCNSDGSGFAFKRDGESVVTVSKGYFQVEAMIEKLKSLNLTEADELMVHHRIGTSGRVTPENTHPFVISDVESEVSAVNITIDKPVMVHNGMFWHIRDFMALNPDFSDTYAFARYILGNRHILGLYKDTPEFFKKLFDSCIGTDKICIMFPDKDMEMMGNFVEHNGYFHSNSGYCRYVSNRGGYEWGEHHGRESGDTSLSVSSSQKEEEEAEEQSHSKAEEETENEEINEGLNCRLGDTLPKRNLIKLTDDSSIPLFPSFVLDSTYITLNSKNINHFAYVEKYRWDNALPDHRKVLVLKYMNNYDPEAIYNTVQYRLWEKATKVYTEGIKTEDLINKYYFIPRGTYFGIIYKDFKQLVDFKVDPTLENIRVLEKLLKHEDHCDKKQKDSIFYPKHTDIFCKMSLELLVEYYRAKYNRKDKKPSILNKILSITD